MRTLFKHTKPIDKDFRRINFDLSKIQRKISEIVINHDNGEPITDIPITPETPVSGMRGNALWVSDTDPNLTESVEIKDVWIQI